MNASQDRAAGAAERVVQGTENASAEPAVTRALLVAAMHELETLYAALDNVHSGLLLLDGSLHAVYSNPSLHEMFKSFSQDVIRNNHPPYEELLRDAVAASSVDVEDYVERRLAWVKAENSPPMDLPMTNGTVLRCHLAALPGGGRMLIYSDVTDIVRNAEEMQRLATVDGMTGIYNRRHFLELADREWNRARRYGRAVSFLMIDIDHFKAINDELGHEIGDRMIVHLASLARSCKRDCDVLARIGGEEFAILLPETTMEQALAVAERLRHHVAGMPLVEVPKPFCATVSIGVATASSDTTGVSDLMKAADQALYSAKRGGRNRVVCSVPASLAPAMQDAAQPASEPNPASANT